MVATSRLLLLLMPAYFVLVLAAPMLAMAAGAAPDDPGDPPYAVNQCKNPIAVIDARTTMPEHPVHGQNWWRGRCVTAEFQDWGSNCTGAPCGATHSYNILVAGMTPNPGTCSATAEQHNGGPKPPRWDFSGAGYCGLGDCKSLLIPGECTWDVESTAALHHGRLACLAHDACVWARCQNDGLQPNFVDAMGGIGNMIESMLSGRAAQKLREADAFCGAALYDTMAAYYDLAGERVAGFFKRNPQYNKDGTNWPSDDSFTIV